MPAWGQQQFAPRSELAAGFEAWTLLNAAPPEAQALEAWIRPEVGQVADLDLLTLADDLAAAPLEFTPAAGTPLIVALPNPDGSFERFALVESPIMEPGLAEQFPDIRTYAGYGIDDPYAALRADITMHGFHAQVLTPRGRWYIDPYSRGDLNTYSVYYRRDLVNPHDPLECQVLDEQADDVYPLEPAGLASGNELRTFRTAVSATGEYTAFHGGTVPAGLAAIVTAMNRVSGVYEVDVAVRLTLIANNNLLVYTNAGSDPFSNNDGFSLLGQNQSTIDSVIGTANYDVGHVFSTGGGGVASLGVVCVGGSKARGVTGQPAPIGDPFYIDYVAHEMGHQFGGNHTFNGVNGSCSGGNRNGSTAYEPGSGTTIMAYAGICGADDTQSNSDPYFHGKSYDEIRAHVLSRTCHVASPTGNSAPTVDAGPSYTIPRSTPFTLTASGSDPNPEDSLTYCWEEFDLGPAISLATPDNGSSPLFRSRNPVASPSRTFPPLANILNNTTPLGERLPTTTRTMTFRCTVRDNRLNGGGVDFDATTVSVTAAAGPFAVTFPNGGGTLSGGIVATWNVAGTSAAPVNTQSVNILLSTDNGLTFPTVLAASTPNDGSEAVNLPAALSTTQARIRIEAVNNIYFDVSNAPFTVEPAILFIEFPNGRPTSAEPGVPIPFDVDIVGGTEGAVPGSETLQLRVNGGAYQPFALTPQGGSLYTATIPAGLCDDVFDYYVEVLTDDTATMVRSPLTAPSEAYTVAVEGDLTVAVDDNFNTDQGWSAGGTATTGGWQRGVPVNDAGWAYDPAADFDGSGQCYLTQNTVGNSDVDNGAAVLTSPILDMSAPGDWTLNYAYYLYLTNAPGDYLVVEMRDASIAGPWIEIARHDTNGFTSWRTHLVDQAQLDAAGVTLSDQMQLRFIANDSDPQSIVEAGVDAVRIDNILCVNPVPDCPGDIDNDGDVDIDDLLTVLGSFGTSGGDPQPGDADGDSDTDIDDLLMVLGGFGECR